MGSQPDRRRAPQRTVAGSQGPEGKNASRLLVRELSKGEGLPGHGVESASNRETRVVKLGEGEREITEGKAVTVRKLAEVLQMRTRFPSCFLQLGQNRQQGELIQNERLLTVWSIPAKTGAAVTFP